VGRARQPSFPDDVAKLGHSNLTRPSLLPRVGVVRLDTVA
jgi:hypothetical protein